MKMYPAASGKCLCKNSGNTLRICVCMYEMHTYTHVMNYSTAVVNCSTALSISIPLALSILKMNVDIK